MKIYFCGSISGGRQDRFIYGNLIENLKQYGHVFTEHVGVEVLECEVGMSDKEIHDRDVAWLKQCDVVVAEVSQTSTGVGYELGRAIERGFPTLCLFRENSGKVCSPMVTGAHNGELVVVKNYSNEEEAFAYMKDFMTSYKKKRSVCSPMVTGAHDSELFVVKNYSNDEETFAYMKDFISSNKNGNKTYLLFRRNRRLSLF